MKRSNLLLAVLVTAAAAAQPKHSPPSINTPTNEPVRLEMPKPPPVPHQAQSNGTSGWVDTKKPAYITPADIAAKYRIR